MVVTCRPTFQICNVSILVGLCEHLRAVGHIGCLNRFRFKFLVHTCAGWSYRCICRTRRFQHEAAGRATPAVHLHQSLLFLVPFPTLGSTIARHHTSIHLSLLYICKDQSLRVLKFLLCMSVQTISHRIHKRIGPNDEVSTTNFVHLCDLSRFRARYTHRTK